MIFNIESEAGGGGGGGDHMTKSQGLEIIPMILSKLSERDLDTN